MTCKKHPKYKALRKPRAKCKVCLDIYKNKTDLTFTKKQITIGPYTTNTGSKSYDR